MNRKSFISKSFISTGLIVALGTPPLNGSKVGTPVYTGLLDKHGNKIYIGDKLRFEKMGQIYTLPVILHNGVFQFDCSGHDFGCDMELFGYHRDAEKVNLS